MEIAAIKEGLSITAVLEHYGLRADKHNRVHCPFHNDSTPSLQVYPKTNTYCCFSSNCHAGTGDVIQFIQLKENCSKHEAISKAASLVSGIIPAPAKLFIADTVKVTPLEKVAVLTRLFKYFSKALPLTKKAVEYTASRGIDYKQHEIGSNAADWHHKLKEVNFIKACEGYGLLKPRPAGGYSVWAKDCIIFPLKNCDNKIVSLYGRSITNNEDSRHFYLTNREGLYPGYPALTTTRLILTESIIDAASLLQQESIKNNYTVLALYGTNGLTQEHQQAIIGLPQLAEIIFMLDADEAGEAAVNKHYATLKQLLPEVTITKVNLPQGEDINSVLQAHDDATVLHDLIEQRTEIFLSTENEKEPPVTIAAPALQHSNKLNTTNPELLIYNDAELYIEVLGGIKITGLDRMKVTLKILHKDQTVLPVWHSLDLYNHGQREQAISSVAETFEHPITATATTIAALTSALEGYRLQRIEALQPKQEYKEAMTAAERQAAINELQKPKLLQRTSQLIEQSGIVGESANSLIAYLVYCTRKQHTPLHVMFLGASGSGKTYLQERISDLVPEEEKIEITQITENALYYFKQHELQNKLILIEDLDGAMSVFYPLRELQTKRRISKTVTLKDTRGNLKTITLRVEGPVCVSGCTTKEKIYEDNANRCILLYTDMSKDQDKLINGYQTKLAAGEVNREREQQYKALFKNMQRVLQPVQVINPYAKYIVLPEQVFKPRRTMTLLLGFIEAITFYHQYQRTVKKDKAGNPYIESTVADIEAAFTLLKDVLFSKSDELTKATRDFLEQLKQLLHENGATSFNAKQIRERTRINPGNMKRYLAELSRYGYVKGSGNRYRGSYEYMIVNMEEYEALKSSIDGHLQTILKRISSSVVQ
jgi:DNA primase/DNA-binding MarR family transcriptional regulator